MELDKVQQLFTVILNLAVALAVGAGLSLTWLRGASSPWACGKLGWLRGAALAAVAMALLAHIALLWLQSAAMAEVAVGDAAPAVLAALAGTHFGAAWLAGLGALLAAGAAALVRARAAQPIGLLALCLFLYSRSIVSHAGADGDVSLLAAADWLHQILISVWVGEVLVAALGTLRQAATEDRGRLEQAGYVQALSDSASVALAGILASGLYALWHAIGSLDNLGGNAYSTILLVKLSLVGAAALLGASNRFVVMPGLLAGLRAGAGGSPTRRFARVLQVEAVVLAAVLVAAAVLSSTAQPAAG